MALLGLLVADQGEHLSGGAVDALLLLNPADAYRLFNLAGLADVRLLTGMAALAGETGLTPPLLLAALLAWALVPLRRRGGPLLAEGAVMPRAAVLLALLAVLALRAATTRTRRRPRSRRRWP